MVVMVMMVIGCHLYVCCEVFVVRWTIDFQVFFNVHRVVLQLNTFQSGLLLAAKYSFCSTSFVNQGNFHFFCAAIVKPLFHTGLSRL